MPNNVHLEDQPLNLKKEIRQLFPNLKLIT